MLVVKARCGERQGLKNTADRQAHSANAGLTIHDLRVSGNSIKHGIHGSFLLSPRIDFK
jgi:hypothetical protein